MGRFIPTPETAKDIPMAVDVICQACGRDATEVRFAGAVEHCHSCESAIRQGFTPGQGRRMGMRSEIHQVCECGRFKSNKSKRCAACRFHLTEESQQSVKTVKEMRADLDAYLKARRRRIKDQQDHFKRIAEGSR